MSLQLSALRPSPFPNTTNSNPKTATTTTTGHHLYERTFISTHIYTHPSAILLELCTSTKELHQILPHIIKNGVYNEHLIQTKLVRLFCKYGSISEAVRVFEPVEQKLDVLYHTMLKGYAKNSTLCDALSFYHRMQCDEVRSDVYDFIYLLQLCGKNLDIKRGREIHGRIITNGLESNLFAMNGVMDFYVKCGQMNDAYKMFERMPQKDLISWTSLVKGFAQNGSPEKAVHLFLEMQEAGQKPDAITLVSVLPAVADIGDLRIGRSIHGRIITNGFESNLFAVTAVVDFYAKCGQINDAYKMFKRMPQKDLISWTSLVKGFALNGSPEKAVHLVLEMQEAGQKPDYITLVSVLPAVADIRDLRIGRSIHGYAIRSGFESLVNVSTALLDMYFKCGSVETARLVFEGMSSKFVGQKPDSVTLVTVLPAVADIKALRIGRSIHGYAIRSGFESLVHVSNALLDMYFKCGSVETARLVFERMSSKFVGQKPDSVTLATVLPAVADIKALRIGRSIHGYAIRSGVESLVDVSNALLDMYFKCGSVETARLVFERMSSKNVFSWNTMTDGLAQNGESEEAYATFLKMLDEGVKPTNGSMMGALRACSNLGDLERGRFVHRLLDQLKLGSDVSFMTYLISMYSKCKRVDIAASIFKNLKGKTNVTWNAMISGYAQNGCANEALNLFYTMQSRDIKPDSFTFVSVITALADLSVTRQAKWIHGLAIRTLMDKNVFVATALVDMYAKCGAIETARKLFDMMQERHVITWNAEHYQHLLSERQTQIGEANGNVVQEVDGVTRLQLWQECVGGRSHGRVYGPADLSANLRRGATSLTQPSQAPSTPMSGWSAEAERAARLRAEVAAARAEKRALSAEKTAKEAQEQVKALESNMQTMMMQFQERMQVLEHQSAGASCSTSRSSPHPHYDDDLDDQSLDGDD